MIFTAFKNFLKNKNITRGFTLIELLVVISIIAILSAVATVSYTNVQKKSRDGKRKSDLAAIQQALEVFYADNGAYPDEDDTANKITCTISGTPGTAINWGSAFSCPTSSPTKTYMQQLPSDPIALDYIYEVYSELASGDWCATTNGKCQKYTLWVRLENSNDPDIATSTNDSICTVSRTLPSEPAWHSVLASQRNYCVHSPR